jgi:hypothetical protein
MVGKSMVQVLSKVERRLGLSVTVAACAIALALSSVVTLAQSQPPKKKAPPKPEATPTELFEYVRGALLAYSPDDRVNDNLEVSIDPTNTVITVKQPDGHCDIFLSALDANTISWDVYDATDSSQTRAPLARMTVVSAAGKTARTCYDTDNNVDQAIPSTRARFLFSWDRIPESSGLQTKMTKAMKKLIKLSGGYAEKNIFK